MAPELGGSSGRTRQRKLGGCDFHGRVENRHGRGDQRHSGAEFGEGLGRARASRERGARRRGLGKREAAARAQGGAAELGIRERESSSSGRGRGRSLGAPWLGAWGKSRVMGEARDQERAGRARGRGREERLGRWRKLVRRRLDKAPARVGDEDEEATTKKIREQKI
jgi:hypothetical protein